MKALVCAYACIKDPDNRYGGGGEGFLGWSILEQISRYSDVWVLTYSGNRRAIEEKLSGVIPGNVRFYYITLLSFLNFLRNFAGGVQIYAYLWQIKAFFVAKKLHAEVKFDVFHHLTYANDWMASYIGALLPIAYIRGPGGGAHRVPDSFIKEYSFKGRLAEKIRSMGQWFFRHDPFFIIGQNRARAILVCNKEAFNALPKKWQRKACLFPVNGISKEDLLLTGAVKRYNNQGFSVITAGKLIKIKGFDFVIRAFKIFSSTAEGSKLIIVGRGIELENLKKISEDLNIENKIVFETWMPREDLLKRMSSSDAFIFASLRDGGGNVVIEAMSAGLPVVCFDIAGPGFHIDNECGIKIKTNNPEQAVKDFAEALERLYLDKELRIRLSEGAREKAEKEYSWDKLGNRLNKIYEKALCKELL